MTVGGITYSTADGSLKTAGPATSGQGSSAIGSYTSTTNHWLAGSTKFETSISSYGAAFSIYTQTFPDGATGTMKEGEVSARPCPSFVSHGFFVFFFLAPRVRQRVRTTSTIHHSNPRAYLGTPVAQPTRSTDAATAQ